MKLPYITYFILLNSVVFSSQIINKFVNYQDTKNIFKLALEPDIFDLNLQKNVIVYECKFGWGAKWGRYSDGEKECQKKLEEKNYDHPLMLQEIEDWPKILNSSLIIPGVAPLDMIFGKDGYKVNFDASLNADSGIVPLPIVLDALTKIQDIEYRNRVIFSVGNKGVSVGSKDVKSIIKAGDSLMKKISIDSIQGIVTVLLPILTKSDLDIWHQHTTEKSDVQKKAFSYRYNIFGNQLNCVKNRIFDLNSENCSVQFGFKEYSDENLPNNQWKDNEVCEEDDEEFGSGEDEEDTSQCSEHKYVGGNLVSFSGFNSPDKIKRMQVHKSFANRTAVKLFDLALKTEEKYFSLYTLDDSLKINGDKASFKKVLDFPKMSAVEDFEKHVKHQFSWIEKMSKKYSIPLHLDVLAEEMNGEDFDLRKAFQKLHFNIHGDYFQRFIKHMFTVDIDMNFQQIIDYSLQWISQFIYQGLEASLSSKDDAPIISLPRVEQKLVGKNITVSNLSMITREYLTELKKPATKTEIENWINEKFTKAFE